VGENVQIQDNPEQSRYDLAVDGTSAGFLEYALHGTHVDFLHTEVHDEFAGRGLASELIRSALDDARQRGLRVAPYCPFVRKFIAKHAEYLDLVPEAERARFGL
jgi:predicted GNAT family acetyltransferase